MNDFEFKKKFGQNFLTDKNLLTQIVEKSGVMSDEVVVEIGAGRGALTEVLGQYAKKVYSFEIDKELFAFLTEKFDGTNVEMIFKDVMQVSDDELNEIIGSKFRLVANLPYYITTPIIMQFIEQAKNIKAMVIMVQEEVAYRLSAKESTSDYGAITVAINLRGSAEVVMRVPRDKFTPPPNVDSAVVKITLEKGKNQDVDMVAVRDVVRCGFSSRRKMLVNNIMNTYKLSRKDAEQALENCGISTTVRGENLTAEDYIKLCNNLPKRGK